MITDSRKLVRDIRFTVGEDFHLIADLQTRKDMAALCEHLIAALDERDEERAIVDRVWKALGITTYDQAKPFAIDEHVARLQAENERWRIVVEQIELRTRRDGDWADRAVNLFVIAALKENHGKQ